MRTKSPDKRRQKPVGQPYGADVNPETAPQYFQISVNVIEARKLAWLNLHSANSYVIVVLGKKKRRTSIRRNMQEPCFREYFTFEQYVSIREIQRSNLWLAVMEPRCCAPPRVLGEVNIDLATVWAQPYHQVFHKWAQLSLPQNPAAGAVGYLKVDLSIIFKGDVQVMSVTMDEKVENNLLLPSGVEQQPANYVITIYRVFGLQTQGLYQTDRRYGKPPSVFIRVSFCGLMGKTGVQHRSEHPTFCEQISIVEMFPNMCEIVRFDVCSGEGSLNKVVATSCLKLGQISHDGENGFLPTFGPSLLHMYGTMNPSVTGISDDGPYHRGAMLVSLRTIVPYYQQALKTVSVEPVSPIRTENLWLLEDLFIICPLLEVSMLDRHVCGKLCGVAVTIGELPSNDQGDGEFINMMDELRNRKLHYTGSLEVTKSGPVFGYLNFPKALPVLQLATRLPDFRFRVYRNNMVYGIVTDLEQALSVVEDRLNKFQYTTSNELTDELNAAVDSTAANLLKYLDIIQYSTSSTGSLEEVTQKYSTELDQKQLGLQKEEIEKIYQELTKRSKCMPTLRLIRTILTARESYPSTNSRKELKIMLAEIKAIAEKMKSLIYKTSEGWPDIVIWLLSAGSRIAYHKIPMADVIYSVIPEQNGRNCGRVQTIYLKPLKCTKHPNSMAVNCFCVAAKIELMLWAGLFRQVNAFEVGLPAGYSLKVKDLDMCLKSTTTVVEYRVFIGKAKLNNDVNFAHQLCPFVRVNVLNMVKETAHKQNTSTPVWNQILKVQRLIFASPHQLSVSPPHVLVEVYSTDNTGKSELLGRCSAVPVLEDRSGYQYAPKLRWFDLYRGTEHTGQLFMSVQVLQIPETLIKNTFYSPVEEIHVAAEVNTTPTDDRDNIEIMPPELIPTSTTYKVDIYWWGLREVNSARRPCVMLEIDDLIIRSDIITDKKINCNFPNGKMTQIFKCPVDETYCPPLNIKLYDNSTFGRTLFLGSNVVKNPRKYKVNWLPKTEREDSLRSASITSANFFQVGQMLYVKKSPVSTSDSIVSLKSNYPSKAKRSWRKLLSRKDPDEEEYVLLPIFVKEKDTIKQVKNYPSPPEFKDWWTRYFASQQDDSEEDVTDKITFFDSELELQPEFFKFKDWCFTLKLYNGNKTGIPEKDDQLYCGFLKAGIAMYRWPPTQGTVAVNCHGVDLNQGYFNDHPSNLSTKFLVRVYVVKAIDLAPEAFSGRSDSYIVISCGNKRLGDRKNYVSNNLNPVFGRMYEFRCTLPEDYLLTISLFDCDASPPDEIIGSTNIDLEDRIYSKHRARVGLPSEYNATGPAKWRDCMKPSGILEELCARNHMPAPSYPNPNTVIVNGVEYRNTEDKNHATASESKESLCLSLLRKWHTLPMCGYHLVPEHVEARTLFHPEKPVYTQGKLQMWVDIFPLDSDVYIPPPVDITPRKMEDYELRVIVWNVQNIRLDDENFRKKSLNIYVRAWVGTSKYSQYTDVQYDVLSGEGSFNWRMIFHFQYQHAEKKLVMKEKGPFTEVEERVQPVLVVQVMDSEAVSPQDFLASLSLNLTEMTRGLKLADQCTLQEVTRAKEIDLFSAMSTRGWWPLASTDRSDAFQKFAGVVDLELTLLPKEKALLMPVGLGREPPSPLPTPHMTESRNTYFKDLKISKDAMCMITAILILFLSVVAIYGFFKLNHVFVGEC